MKGIFNFKGFKYISQIFEEEEKEDEIQIGLPTDVKHVAHIGWDGPAVDTPSWMNQFSGSPGLHSAPLGPPTGGEKGSLKLNGSLKEKRLNKQYSLIDPSTKRSNRSVDLPDVPRSSRHSQSAEGNGELSPKKQKDPNKVKQRRNHSRETSEGGSVKSNREPSDPGVPDPAKKSRRKKSKESNGTGGSARPRSRANIDPGPDGESSVKNSELDNHQNN